MVKEFISEGLVEQHIHGCFGIDFMTCSKDDIIDAAKQLANYGVTAFFPTIMTDNLETIKRQISIVESAKNLNVKKIAQIAGIHLEGPFINPEKSGIHQKECIQPLDIDVFRQIESDLIKIVTLAPEMDKTGKFIEYLKSKFVYEI